ncbi:MAG: YceI family protein [Myxococcaceae bacterium]|nr:YceI family protein [Myxococcaceae bacterium]
MAISKRLVLWAVLVVSGVAFGEPPLDLEIPPSEQVGLTLTPGAVVRVEGTSAWRSFASQATVVNFTGSAEAPSAEVTALRSDLTNAYRDRYPFQVELIVPVAGLKSGDEGLDEKLASTLNEKQHPNLVFRMQGYEPHNPAGAGQSETVTLRGTLSVAGREKPVTVSARVAWSAGIPRLMGRFDLSLASYGLEAPRFFYFIRADDRVSVSFDLGLRAAPSREDGAGWNIQ